VLASFLYLYSINAKYKRMTPEEYIQLYEKYVAGHCSPEEKQLLFSYGDSFQLQEPEIKLSVEDRQARLRGYHDLTDRLNRSKRIIRMRTWWAAAAVLLIFCITGLLFSLGNHKPASNVIVSTAILPGKPMAVLTLDNGKTIRLDEARNGVLAETAGSTIRKMKNGELVYQALGNQIGDDQPINNTISIPAGGEYQLTLPDGTKVWLNSASRLTVPTRFSGSERYV
jgi:transmembrane sensor